MWIANWACSSHSSLSTPSAIRRSKTLLSILLAPGEWRAKKTNQGILVLLAVKDRKSRVEIGRGAEPYVTDGFCRQDPPGHAAQFASRGLWSRVPGRRTCHGGRGGTRKGRVAFAADDGLAPRVPPDQTPAPSGHGIPIGADRLGRFLPALSPAALQRRRQGRRLSRAVAEAGGGFLTGFLLSSLLNSGGRGPGRQLGVVAAVRLWWGLRRWGRLRWIWRRRFWRVAVPGSDW